MSNKFEKILKVIREKGIKDLDIGNVVIMDLNKPTVTTFGSMGETISPILLVSGLKFYTSDVSTMIWMATL